MADIDLIYEICKKDARYKPDAYEFTLFALQYAIAANGTKAHISCRQMTVSYVTVVVLNFGVMARFVLEAWGTLNERDLGNVIFNMIGVGLLDKTDDDTIEEFDPAASLTEMADAAIAEELKEVML